MTNAEKFKEVFGIAIDKTADDPCGIFDCTICVEHECENCPAYDFWNKEYGVDN